MEIIGPRTRKALQKASVEPAEYLAAVGLLLQAGWELGWVPGRGWRARHRQRGEAWLSRQHFTVREVLSALCTVAMALPA